MNSLSVTEAPLVSGDAELVVALRAGRSAAAGLRRTNAHRLVPVLRGAGERALTLR
jgi:hypothetical protein